MLTEVGRSNPGILQTGALICSIYPMAVLAEPTGAFVLSGRSTGACSQEDRRARSAWACVFRAQILPDRASGARQTLIGYAVTRQTTNVSPFARILDEARRKGTAELSPQPRRWPRYCLGKTLEVCTDTARPQDSWRVTMHNISAGGLGFWSDRPIPNETTVYVRDPHVADASGWAPTKVARCSAGIGGFLVGTSFQDTLLPASPFFAVAPGATSGQGPQSTR